MKNQKPRSRIQVLLLILVIGLLLPVVFAWAQEPEEGAKIQIGEGEASGQNVTFDFKDADIKNVLKIISYKSGINIVAMPEVRGAVTIRLHDVHWEKALETIVRTYGFGYEWLNDKVIMVSTLEKLAEQRKSQEAAAEKEPLDTKAFALNFSKAEEVKVAIEKLVSERGRIALEVRTNTLIITDTKSNLVKISRVIDDLDKVTPQVLIEARIVETTLSDTERMGIKWTVGGTIQGSARPTTFPFTTSSDNKYLPDNIPAATTAPDKTGSLFQLGTLDATSTMAILDLLFTDTDTEMLSNPRIVTLDNQPAVIEVVTLDPTPQWSYNKEQNAYVMTNYRQEKYGITLKVTPQVNKLGYVTLNIQPEVSEWLRDKTLSGGSGLSVDLPVIYRQTTSTTVMVKDGNTLVIGGLIKNKTTDTTQKIPILGDIPILGLLFRHTDKTTEKKDLLIFITPRILTIEDSEG
ncbi:MAG: type IV pilus secretin PilQ [Candidatus Omnitrophota bacterium]